MPDRTHPSAPTPAALLVQARRDLAARGDPARAASTRAFFKKSEPLELYGLSVPETRLLARGYAKGVRGAWEVGDAVAFASLAIAEQEMETKFVGMFVLNRFQRDFPRALVVTVKDWLAAGLCNNWALVDTLSAEVIAPLLTQYPALVQTVTGWSSSKDLWLRRSSIVPFASLTRHGAFVDEAFGVATTLLGDDEDLIHKATGWILREAGASDPARLIKYLGKHGKHMSRTTLRYAIEKLSRAQRTRLMAETRP